jgi:hypothetical protein
MVPSYAAAAEETQPPNLNSYFAALTLPVRFNGYTVEADKQIHKTPQFTEDVVDVAREWFDKRTRK